MMKFDQIIESFLQEEKKAEEDYETMPWSIEIIKDSNRSELYNNLGNLIIRLYEIRSRLD
jgi:hypothetical protein